MDREKRQIRHLLLWALILFMFASLLGLFILFQPDENLFQYYLTQADLYEDAKRYRDIPSLLIRASRYADTEREWFSLFKRSYVVCRETEDYTSFHELLERSRKFLKAGPKHNALYTASLLWTDQYEKAAASLYAIGQPGFETLAAESLLSFEVYRNYALEDQDPIEFIKDKITSQEDPDFFRIIGTLAQNDVLLYNASLLYMETGQYDQAESLLRNFSSSRIPPYRKGVLYYDLGLFDEALESYLAQDVVDDMKENQRFSLKQQIGDLQYMLGRKSQALASYEAGLSLHPEGSWKLYRNTARIYYDQGYSRKAKSILEEGLERFPDEIALLSDYIRLFAEDHTLAVRNGLEAYLLRFPEDMEARLLRIRYFPDPMNPTQYQARLWEYFNQAENNEAVTRFLLWYLAGLGDSPSLSIVLNRFRYGEEKPHWYLFYEGIAHFLRQDIEQALIKLEQAAALYPSWLYQRNMAMLNYSQGRLETAMMQLMDAIDGLGQEPSILNGSVLLSEMYGTLGEMFLDQDDFESAAESFRTAVRLDPENHRAQSLLSRIE